MTDPERLDAALGRIDESLADPEIFFDDLDEMLEDVATLVAAVRELQQKCDVLEAPALNYNRTLARAEKAEADLAALKGRTCKTCLHMSLYNDEQTCDRVANNYSCSTFGFICGAWTAKEGA